MGYRKRDEYGRLQSNYDTTKQLTRRIGYWQAEASNKHRMDRVLFFNKLMDRIPDKMKQWVKEAM